MRIAGRDGHGDVRHQEPRAAPLQVGKQEVAEDQGTQDKQRVAPGGRAVVLDRIDENQEEGGQDRGLGPDPFAPPPVEHPGEQQPRQQRRDPGGQDDRKRQEANREMAQDPIQRMILSEAKPGRDRDNRTAGDTDLADFVDADRLEQSLESERQHEHHQQGDLGRLTPQNGNDAGRGDRGMRAHRTIHSLLTAHARPALRACGRARRGPSPSRRAASRLSSPQSARTRWMC